MSHPLPGANRSRSRPNPNLPKCHRTYTAEETARLFGVHKNTVRAWIKDGLPVLDSRKPLLIAGDDLANYLRERRARNKRPCGPGQLYCVRCRRPQEPAGAMVDYEIVTPEVGNVVGLCPDCGTLMNRRTALARLAQTIGPTCDVQMLGG